MKKCILPLALLGLSAVASHAALANTQVMMLGTGTPVPDGERAGSGIAVIHDDEAYVFDIGPGVVERATQAAERFDIEPLNPTNIDHLFLTHLHSDHILDFPELLGTYWWRRTDQLQVFGPEGTQAMSEGAYSMLADDTETRLKDKSPVTNPDAAYADVTEITAPGTVFEKDDIKVEAFPVSHGDWDKAYGYKVTTPDKTIVISGDTSINEEVRRQAANADILIHEVISRRGWEELPEQWQAYHQYAHTLTDELAELAGAAEPDLLVLYHVLHYGAPIESVLDEVQSQYDGEVVLANDLDLFQ
ncbi:MBL fold metallo-hydrolase [Halomonas elongata]|uniref:MBL fold metallo-hydrolase n=1 Tax=Halomonas elongata TaxID=2746 RepID=UPI00186B6B0F|nr:MBL fold metallo-hydrolase [Halomonas elongata]MBW5801975.1 MBL fold metallo-hydrolase [Halomonas elongata]MDL4861079.1 MBL fold metallo-hydrolase [Halomonas elongata]